MTDLRSGERLVSMTFTLDELAFMAGAVVAIGDRHDLLGRIHAKLEDDGHFGSGE